jgi:glutaredoxin
VAETFNRLGVPYVQYNIDKFPEGKDVHEVLKTKYGQRTVPYVIIDGEMIGEAAVSPHIVHLQCSYSRIRAHVPLGMECPQSGPPSFGTRLITHPFFCLHCHTLSGGCDATKSLQAKRELNPKLNRSLSKRGLSSASLTNLADPGQKRANVFGAVPVAAANATGLVRAVIRSRMY